MRADSGFYTHAMVAVCRKAKVRFSRHHARQTPVCAVSSRPYPRQRWTPIPIGWRAPRRGETDYTPFESKPDAATVRLIVRGSSPRLALAPFTNYSYPPSSPTGTEIPWTSRPTSRHAEIVSHPRPQVRRGAQPPPLGTLPRQRRAGRPGDGPQPGTLDNAHRPGRATGPPRPSGGVSSPWPDGSLARPAVSPCTCPRTGPGGTSLGEPWRDCAPCHPLLTAPTASDHAAYPIASPTLLDPASFGAAGCGANIDHAVPSRIPRWIDPGGFGLTDSATPAGMNG